MLQIEFFLLSDTIMLHAGDQQGFTCIFYTGNTLLDPEIVSRATQHSNRVIIPTRPDLQAQPRRLWRLPALCLHHFWDHTLSTPACAISGVHNVHRILWALLLGWLAADGDPHYHSVHL